MPWSSDERRSDSWAPSWTTPTFGGEALDLDPPQGQPPHHHRFWDVKTSVFFSWEKVYQNPEGFEKKNININVIMWPWREILHQGLWIPWATFCRQRLCWKNRRDFEKSNKRLVGKIHGKKGTKKSLWKSDTLRSTNIAMENPPILDVFPIGKGGFPLLC